MFQENIPYGSQQLPDDHGQCFAMPWVGQLVTQSVELNVEHEAVLQKLNNLLRALNTNDRNRIIMACTNMSAEARAHFTKEEALMQATDYPDRTAHIEQHEDLLRRLARIRFVLTSNPGFWSPANERLMLENWFVPHLTYADRRFADFIAASHAKLDAA